jgi:tetratricopeptide (TPR) repeat protein
MQQDQRGYPVTTDDSTAVEELDRAFNAYVGFRTDAMAHLDAAIAADPGFALPRIIKGTLIAGLKKPELYPLASGELEAAKNCAAPVSQRESHYMAALEAALVDNVTAAVTHYEQIANDHPLDLFALRIAQSELFWIGEVAWMRDISERAAPRWNPDVSGYSSYLSIRAFGLEENGDYALAEKCGREAVDRNPADCWGAHAVAHVLIMQGRLLDGVGWLSELSTNWSAANHIVHHLWWHLALFHTEHGDYDSALELYDHRLRDLDSPLMQAIPDYYVDIQNDTALLQRLELRGVDIADRWQPIGDLAQTRVGNHASPFTSAHSALGTEICHSGAACKRSGDRTSQTELPTGDRYHDAGQAQPLANGWQSRTTGPVFPAAGRCRGQTQTRRNSCVAARRTGGNRLRSRR